MPAPIKILFVCGRHNRRSPTAERLFKNDRRMEVRSAGLHETSRRRISAADLVWADLILVMERKHEGRIRAAFRQVEAFPPMESLDISDEYIFMQAELVEALKAGVESVLEERRAASDAAAP